MMTLRITDDIEREARQLEAETLCNMEQSGVLYNPNPAGIEVCKDRYFYFYLGRISLRNHLHNINRDCTFMPMPDGKSHPGNFVLRWWHGGTQPAQVYTAPEIGHQYVMLPYAHAARFLFKDDIIIGIRRNRSVLEVMGFTTLNEMELVSQHCHDGNMYRTYRRRFDSCSPIEQVIDALAEREKEQ